MIDKIETVTIANATFDVHEMDGVVIALNKAGFLCNGALAAKLWSRFSQDQCATWMQITEESAERFVIWVSKELDKDEAFG
jgi:hypothetical protein